MPRTPDGPLRVNRYSDQWFETFLSSATAAPVDRELQFFTRHLPATDYPRVLDVACGIGRHAGPLTIAGYRVTGLDVSEEALALARERVPDATFVLCDMRELDRLGGEFDVVACLWQSWGGFTPEQNRAVLESMSRRLRSGGRVLLDVYHRQALAALPEHEEAARGGTTVTTDRRVDGDRYRVVIGYSGSDDQDRFDWQVFAPAELRELGEDVGLRHLLTCAWFDASVPPSPEHVRMQALFEHP